jgi:hypothetical protein
VVFQAKSDLTRRKMMSFDDRVVDTTEQELALRYAVARLEFAREQVEVCQRWGRKWPQAVTEYQGPAGQLKGFLEGDLPRACAFLERKITSLEAYVTTTPVKPREEGKP